MTRRRSIEIEGYRHANPIPAASVVGGLLMSGVVYGRDAATGETPATLEEQCALVFRHVRDIARAAGGSADDIVKINVWLRDPARRDAVNAEWTAMFPDPDSRPARHTHAGDLPGPYLVACDFVAVLP